MLVLLALSVATLLFGSLDPRILKDQRQAQTTRSLALAKAALLGYASSYPEQHRTGPGPGYLPCPDVDDDGSPDSACPRASIGRLPWRRLGIHDVRDSSGERLWYVLADEFRNNPFKYEPLNTETLGSLSLNDREDYAAVVFAPGPSLSGQERHLARNNPIYHLEGNNALPAGRQFFSYPHNSNDRAIGLTGRKIVEAAELRALREVKRLFSALNTAVWLKPFTADSSVSAAGEVGVRHGYLSVHKEGEAFPTGFHVRWHLGSTVFLTNGSVTEDDLQINSATVASTDGSCLWFGANRVDCTGVAIEHIGTRRREITLSLSFDCDRYVVEPPNINDVRRRNAYKNGRLNAGNFAIIKIEDTDRVTGVGRGKGELHLTGTESGEFDVLGIRYAIDTPLELPHWFSANAWHELLFFAFGVGHVPGVSSTNCVVLGNCLEILVGDDHLLHSPGVVIGPGVALAHQKGQRSTLTGLFEGENGILNDRFEQRPLAE